VLPRPLNSVQQEFLRFSAVGVLGFVVNVAATFFFSRFANLYLAGACAFLVAATFTWYLNRHWTFLDRAHAPWRRQFLRFLGANFVGFLVYFSVYSAIITVSDYAAGRLYIAVACGSVAGLMVNFTLSRVLVFQNRPGKR
jgi:putative flippase GtrA